MLVCPSTRATKDEPGTRGVRLHDLRHSFATMHLMAGTHFMQVSKWLGHATYTLTLNTYGDWIPEEDAADVSHLPEPPSNGNSVVGLVGSAAVWLVEGECVRLGDLGQLLRSNVRQDSRR
ncbi:hypothetical protein ACVWWN_002193 [Mycobacterium sp. URHB0021]